MSQNDRVWVSVLNALLIFCSLHSSMYENAALHPAEIVCAPFTYHSAALFYGVFSAQLSMLLHTNINIMIAAFMCVKA